LSDGGRDRLLVMNTCALSVGLGVGRFSGRRNFPAFLLKKPLKIIFFQ
jgi:hypothetical protein